MPDEDYPTQHQDFGMPSEVDQKDSETPLEGSEDAPKVSDERIGYETKSSEKTEHHTLSVRQTAKIFEQNRIPITERTILNRCHPNKRGEIRLDCYFGEVEAKYYITPQSVQEDIQKERSKFTTPNVDLPNPSGELPIYTEETRKDFDAPPQQTEQFPKNSEEFQQGSEMPEGTQAFPKAARDYIRDLEREKYVLEVKHEAQERVIKHHESQQDKVYEFIAEQGKTIGELGQKVRQLEGPKHQEHERSAGVEEARISDGPHES